MSKMTQERLQEILDGGGVAYAGPMHFFATCGGYGYTCDDETCDIDVVDIDEIYKSYLDWL